MQGTTKKAQEISQTGPTVNKKWWLGDNKRQIAIVVQDDENAFIAEESLNTLMKLLEALKMNIGDVAIVNMAKQTLSFSLLKEQLFCKHVLLFGVTPAQMQMPFTMPDYQVQKHGECTVLRAPAITLTSIKNDAAINTEKRKLWESLKKVFA